MKKLLKIIAIIMGVFILIAGVGSIFLYTGAQNVINNTVIQAVDLVAVDDGVYTGSFEEGRFTYTVQVTVLANHITGIDIVDGSESGLVAQIVDEITNRQSVQLDAVSGASATTKALSKAVANSLTK